MKRLFYRGSVIFAWIASYVLILAIMLAVNLFSTLKMSSAIKEEAFSSSRFLMYQAQNSVEARLGDIAKIADQIQINSNIERFLTDLDQEEYPADEFNRIMVDLRGYQSTNGLIEQIYIIPHNSDIAVSCGAVLRGAQFQQLISTCFQSQSGGAFDVRASHSYGEFRLLRTRNSGAAGKTVVGYVKNLTKRVGSRYDATLLILLNQSSLILNLDVREELTERPFYIINDNDEVIASSASSRPALLYGQLLDRPEQFPAELNGQSYTVIQTDSYRYGWKYVLLLPDALVLRDFRQLQKIMTGATLLAILAGVGCALFFSRRHYLPLKDLVGVLESESGQVYGGRRENEFFFLRKAAQDLSQQRRELQSRLKRQMGNLQLLFLTRLLKNELPESMTAREGCRIYDVRFVSDRFLVFALCSASAAMSGAAHAKERRNQQALIQAVLEDSLADGDKGFFLTVDNMQVYLLNLSGEGTESEACARVFHQMEEDLRRLEQQGVRDLIAAASGCASGLEALPAAYIDAYTAAEYCILMNRTGLNHHRDVTFDVSNPSGYFYYYPLQVELRLTNAIKSGDCRQAQSVLDELFQVNFEQNTVPQKLAQCFMYDLISTIIRIIYDLNLTGDEDIENSIATINSLLDCRSIPGIRQGVGEIIVMLTDNVRERSTQRSIADDVLRFVQENYADTNLDIPQIANCFALTPSYLSKRFKNAVGVGLLDYINQYRVNRAAEALVETELNIQNIAESCGFTNSNNFIRVFKKYTGVTPGKYREINGRPGH